MTRGKGTKRRSPGSRQKGQHRREGGNSPASDPGGTQACQPTYLTFRLEASVDFHEAVQEIEGSWLSDGKTTDGKQIFYNLQSWDSVEALMNWFVKGCSADVAALLHFSPDLSKEQRATLHTLCQEKYLSLKCISCGLGTERHAILMHQSSTFFSVSSKTSIAPEDDRLARCLYEGMRRAGEATSLDEVRERIAGDNLNDKMRYVLEQNECEQKAVAAVLHAIDMDDEDELSRKLADHKDVVVQGIVEQSTGRLPLQHSVIQQNAMACKFLLAAGAPLESKNGKGRTALAEARACDASDIEALLLGQGASDADVKQGPEAAVLQEMCSKGSSTDAAAAVSSAGQVDNAGVALAGRHPADCSQTNWGEAQEVAAGDTGVHVSDKLEREQLERVVDPVCLGNHAGSECGDGERSADGCIPRIGILGAVECAEPADAVMLLEAASNSRKVSSGNGSGNSTAVDDMTAIDASGKQGGELHAHTDHRELVTPDCVARIGVESATAEALVNAERVPAETEIRGSSSDSPNLTQRAGMEVACEHSVANAQPTESAHTDSVHRVMERQFGDNDNSVDCNDDERSAEIQPATPRVSQPGDVWSERHQMFIPECGGEQEDTMSVLVDAVGSWAGTARRFCVRHAHALVGTAAAFGLVSFICLKVMRGASR